MPTKNAEQVFVHPDEAHRIIQSSIEPLPAEKKALEEAVDYILAQDVLATCDLPPFDNSAMDGYAVRAEDVQDAASDAPVSLTVRDTIRAGQWGRAKLQPGEAIKIMTGAPMPPGADSVIMKECARETEEGVEFLQAPRLGENVRLHGEDVKIGQVIASTGTGIRPYEIAMLAAQGVTRVDVVRRPRIAVATSGDELVDYHAVPGPGSIRNSNGPALAGLLRRWGCDAWDAGIAPDDESKIRTVIEEALAKSDMLLLTGGVSVGDFDYTRTVLDSLGFEALFWKTAIKPGKPLLYGLLGGKPVFGLPGNPISALVCTEEFVRPAIEKMQGKAGGPPSYHMRGELINAYSKSSKRRQYVFCRVERREGRFFIEVIRPQGSAMLGMACQAQALALAPIGISRLEAGMELEFRWIK